MKSREVKRYHKKNSRKNHTAKKKEDKKSKK